jgi:hypothetical protein
MHLRRLKAAFKALSLVFLPYRKHLLGVCLREASACKHAYVAVRALHKGPIQVARGSFHGVRGQFTGSGSQFTE